MHRFDSIFSPKSIVIIGASSIPGTPGYEILNNIKEGEELTLTYTFYKINEPQKN